MNNRQLETVSLFTCRTFFLGFGFSLLFSKTGKDTWIPMILGSFIGAILIYFLNKCILLNQTKPDPHSKLKKVFLFLFNFIIFSQILFSFIIFAGSFFLINTDAWFLLIPIPLLIYRISKKGYSTIARLSEVLLPLAVIIFSLSYIGLSSHLNLSNFLPVLTSTPLSLLESSLIVASYSTLPYFFFFEQPIERFHLVKKYLLNQIYILIVTFFIIGVLGPNLILVYRYPEYIVLKEIKIFQFFEKAENILSIVWLLDLLISLACVGTNIKEILPKKNPIYYIITLFLLYIIAIIERNYYASELSIYYYLPYFFLGFELLLLVTNYLGHKLHRY